MADIIERVDAWAERAPHQIAHTSTAGSISFATLRAQSDTLAAWLQAHLPAGDAPVAVVGHKEPEMLVAFLGIVKAGRAYVPIDSSLPAARADRIRQLSGAAITLTPAAVATHTARPAPGPAPLRRADPDRPVYVMFTSGSTGEPKGVIITHRCLTTFVDWLVDEQCFAPGQEVFLNQAPFSFDLSVMDTYASLVSGGRLVSLSRDEIASPRQLYAGLACSGVTTWVSTPSFARLCLAERSFAQSMLPSLRRFLFCGETLAPDLASALLARFPAAAVWNTYGPTETTVAVTSIQIDTATLALYAPLPVGRPLPAGRIVTLGADGQPTPEGESGEIVIAGPSVSPGYLGQPELTARAFRPLDGQPAYHTGDHGHFRDGLLFFDGRADDQVKLHGYRIELGDIEANLRSLPGVRDAVAVVNRRPGRLDSLIGFVVLEHEDEDSATRLRTAMAERVPAYMVPHRIVPVASIPLNTNGKADRRALLERLA